jgi:phosphopantetheinyl transferase
MPADAILLARPDGAPEAYLLDARSAGVDESGLRAWARSFTERAGAPHVTRSYRHPFALVSWHHDAVGIDIERLEPCDAEFAQSICTPEEITEWARLRNPQAHTSSMWSSKEALAKALGEPLSYDPRRLAAPMFWPQGRAGCWRAANLPVNADHVAWLCWRSALASAARDVDSLAD